MDAIASWMVWDAKKALEVEDFAAAVVLSAQTALRNAIEMNSLAVLLSERERLGARRHRPVPMTDDQSRTRQQHSRGSNV